MSATPAPSPRGSLDRLPFNLILLVAFVALHFLMQTNSAASVFALVGFLILVIILAAFRLASIGWSAVLSLVLLVPVGNIVLFLALAILPPHYAKTKELDAAARIYGVALIAGVLLLWMASSHLAA